MYKIATRGSLLATRQSGMIQKMLEEISGLKAELFIVKTTGDIVRDRPLSEVQGAGFFTKEIEQALLDKQAQIAVHSLKDLPIVQPHALHLAAIAERENPSEAIITRMENIDDSKPLCLKEGVTIGTSAIRRKAQIKHLRPDLRVINLRGNVTTRIEKVRSGEYDAVMIAYSGLKRVGVNLNDLELRVLDIHHFVPAPGQGALAVETRSDDNEISRAVAGIDHEETRQAVVAERRLLALCGGGCHLPLGANISKTESAWKIAVFWSFYLPDNSEACTIFSFEFSDLQMLVDESYRHLKSFEFGELCKYFGRESKMQRSLLITRPMEKSEQLADKLNSTGVSLISYPILKLEKYYEHKQWNRINQNIDNYDYLIFTSANAVEIFAAILRENRFDIGLLAKMQIAAVGDKTAEACRKYFINAEIIVAPLATGAGLGEYLAHFPPSKALFPCAREAGHVMEEILRKAGWGIDRLEIYSTEPENKENLPEVDTSSLDFICFTSSLAVEYTLKTLSIPDDVIMISIGPKTSESLEALGRRVDWEIPNSNLEWLWRIL